MLGERIKQLRKSYKMTQQELAEKLGITPSAVGMYEQNRREPKYDMLDQLCKIFSVSPDYFLSTDSSVSLASSQTIYRTKASDFDIIIDNLRHDLKEQKGLMFRGEILDDNDLEKIFDAMKIGAEVALKSKK